MTVDSPAFSPSLQERTIPSRRKFEFTRLIRGFGYAAVVLALLLACATFFVLMGMTPIAVSPAVLFTTMIVNGALIAFLFLVILWEIGSLVMARRRGRAAARLHIRIVALFSLIAAMPAILVAVIAGVTLDRGLDNGLAARTRALVESSATLAGAYRNEQLQALHTDLFAIKSELERARTLLVDNPDRFQDFVTSLGSTRRVFSILLVKSDSSVVARAQAVESAQVPPPPPATLVDAKSNPSKPVLIPPGDGNLLGGIVMLAGYDDVFLYVLRPIDPQIMAYLTATSDSAASFQNLEAMRFGIQLAFGLLYVGIAAALLLSAIWLGIALANRLVAPIRRLIDATGQVAQGNFEVHVPARGSDGDLGALGETFNVMTAQLRTQRAALLAASDQIDERRRFTEAVLSGVTAGVLGIDGEGNVTIANRTTERLLDTDSEQMLGRPLIGLLPQLEPLMTAALRDDRSEYRDQISIVRRGRERTLNVRVTSEHASGQAHGYVITLDDITDLVAAQRSSAWADVARRIAHEIKNPLTPIQLSAERLRRRFGKAIGEGREVFDQCTDTIIRQVGDIGRMVDEFSSFARMPKPAFEVRNLSEAIREAVFLIEVAHPDIAFSVQLPEEPLMGRFDARMMGQVLTNVVKNATEAVTAVPPAERKDPGRIAVAGRIERDTIVVDVIDNGIGLPSENRHRLLEPYFTTREKGTGLGLAIVTKIVEEHGGRVELLDSPEVADGGRGAMIRITLPRLMDDAGAAERPADAVPA
jgi:two-component system nitrogen regulation sensor histidine kinase NtrY